MLREQWQLAKCTADDRGIQLSPLPVIDRVMVTDRTMEKNKTFNLDRRRLRPPSRLTDWQMGRSATSFRDFWCCGQLEITSLDGDDLAYLP